MTDLKDYGYSAGMDSLPSGCIPARVTEVHRQLYKAICAHGEVSAGLKGSFLHETKNKSDFPAVGDFVRLKYNENGSSSIAGVMPRTSKFSRTDFSGHAAGYVKTVLEQVVAANFDYVFILSSVNLDFNVNRTARYLTLARQSGGIPVVVLTKVDLCGDCNRYIEETRRVAGDADVVVVSSRTGTGLESLAPYLMPGKTVVFLGMSGVGKSTLLNALAGQELMAVQDIREDDARGRHTTTHRQLVRLPSGALIIDTPGMRELGLWNADEGIHAAFADVEALIAQCRFSNCSHNNEPGCAVQAALAQGSLPPKRWSRYLAQKRESAFVESKSGPAKSRKGKAKQQEDD